MSRTHVEVNAQTGETTERPFTEKEEAELDRMIEEGQELPRDLLAEIDALTAKLARYEKAEAALIQKGVLVADDVKVDATVKAR